MARYQWLREGPRKKLAKSNLLAFVGKYPKPIQTSTRTLDGIV